MIVSLYAETKQGWDYFASIGKPMVRKGKTVGCPAEMSEDEFWALARECFERNFAVKIYRPNSDVDVVLMIDDNKWKFRQR
jgi:hypothetical protein